MLADGEPLRSWATRAAFAWLASLGAAAIAVGGHDAVAGLEINARLLGALVLAGGLVIAAGAAGLRREHASARALALVGALLGIVLGVMASLTQIANDEPDRRLFLWGAIIGLSALSARHARGRTRRRIARSACGLICRS